MTTLHSAAITPVLFGLKNTAAFLQKSLNYAKANNIDPATLVSSRLHPDMMDLAFQVNRLTDSAKMIPVRINASIPPLELPQGDKTIPEFIASIKKAIDYLEAIKPEDINGKEEVEVKFSVGPKGKQREFTYTGWTYVVYFAHPNFWFHVTTAYAILRKDGVDLGKVDFLNGPAVTKIEW